MRTRAKNLAMTVPITLAHQAGTLHLRSEDDIAAYSGLATHSPQFALNITDLHVVVVKPSKKIIARLNTTLSKLTNIEFLQLDIRGITANDAKRIFFDIRLLQLHTFITKTIQHAALVHFIKRHATTLSVLSLGPSAPCFKAPNGCPLRQCGSLCALQDVSGISECIAHLIGVNTHTIRAHSTRASAGHCLLFDKIIATQPLNGQGLGSSVRVLQFEYGAKSLELMHHIRQSIPQVSSMRLREIEAVEGEVTKGKLPSSYPWGNLVSWTGGLQALANLKRFQLQTTSRLVFNPGHEASERSLILSWTDDDENSHKILEEIVLWYCLGRRTSYMSFWVRKNHKWERERCILNGNSTQFI